MTLRSTLHLWRTFILPTVLLLILGGQKTPADEQTGEKNAHTSAPARPVVVVAHRGAHLVAPENTLTAFRKAIEFGCDYVEMDVRQAKDGSLIIMHDSTVDRTTSGTGNVSDMTLASIRQLDVGARDAKKSSGEKVPTFDEALAVCRGRIKIYVDYKSGAPADVISAIEKHGMLKDVVIYGSPDRLHEIKRLRPQVWIMCGHPATREELARLTRDLKPEALDGHQMAWSRNQVGDAHQAGSQVWVDALGPLDGPIGYRWAVDMGVDAIQTDHPEVLLKWLKAAGRR